MNCLEYYKSLSLIFLSDEPQVTIPNTSPDVTICDVFTTIVAF